MARRTKKTVGLNHLPVINIVRQRLLWQISSIFIAKFVAHPDLIAAARLQYGPTNSVNQYYWITNRDCAIRKAVFKSIPLTSYQEALLRKFLIWGSLSTDHRRVLRVALFRQYVTHCVGSPDSEDQKLYDTESALLNQHYWISIIDSKLPHTHPYWYSVISTFRWICLTC